MSTLWPIERVNKHLSRDQALLKAVEKIQAALAGLKVQSDDILKELAAEKASGDPNDELLSVYTRNLITNEVRIAHDLKTLADTLQRHIVSLKRMKERPTPQ